MIYEFLCERCDVIFEEFLSYENRNRVTLCPYCNQVSQRIISTGQMFCGVNGKNNMYDFVDYKTKPYPVKINGRRHWKQHLKECGLHDDVDNRPHTVEELKSMGEVKIDKDKQKREMRETILKSFQDKKHIKEFREKNKNTKLGQMIEKNSK